MTDPFDGMNPRLSKRARRRHEKTYLCLTCKRKHLESGFGTKKNGERYRICIGCREKRRGYYRGIRLGGGVSYKKALPPEKWGQMAAFLNTLCSMADRCGGTPDVMAFMSEYRKVVQA